MIKTDFAQKLKDKIDGKDGKKPPRVRCVLRGVRSDAGRVRVRWGRDRAQEHERRCGPAPCAVLATAVERRLQECGCAAIPNLAHHPADRERLQALSLRGQRRVSTAGVCAALMACAWQITTKSGHISDVEFEPQPPLLVDDETPNDQVLRPDRCGAMGAGLPYPEQRNRRPLGHSAGATAQAHVVLVADGLLLCRMLWTSSTLKLQQLRSSLVLSCPPHQERCAIGWTRC